VIGRGVSVIGRGVSVIGRGVSVIGRGVSVIGRGVSVIGRRGRPLRASSTVRLLPLGLALAPTYSRLTRIETRLERPGRGFVGDALAALPDVA